MTLMDESKTAGNKTVGIEAFCPFTQNPDLTAPLTADGAYTSDVLRIVRGTPNAQELAALVAALMFTRRAHDRAAHDGTGQDNPSDDENHRLGWLREGYTTPAAWTAGP
jgi:hypothetical protein